MEFVSLELQPQRLVKFAEFSLGKLQKSLQNFKSPLISSPLSRLQKLQKSLQNFKKGLIKRARFFMFSLKIEPKTRVSNRVKSYQRTPKSMSATIFVKVTMMVLFQDLSFAEFYREEANEIDVELSDDESEEKQISKDDMRKMCVKRDLLNRADELDQEDLPNTDEIIGFLCSSDQNSLKPRFVEMIEDVMCFKPFYSPSIYEEGADVKISFIATLNSTNWETPDEMERSINDQPFFKSRTGGHVGNYCKFPSRTNPEDQLGELEITADVVRVTDITGDFIWIEEETDEETAELSEEESEDEEPAATHPFYMTHEDLFGPKDVSLDDEVDLDEPAPVKRGWSIMRMLKPKRVGRRFF